MNTSTKLLLLAPLLLASLVGCDSAAGECNLAECLFDEKADSPGPSSPDYRRFEIEIVGEGRVVVNSEQCSTELGICAFELPVNSPVVLRGDFSFHGQAGDHAFEGYCPIEGVCQVSLDQDVHLVADVGAERGDRHFDTLRPVALLPGEPGVIIDIFETPFSGVATSIEKGGPIAN